MLLDEPRTIDEAGAPTWAPGGTKPRRDWRAVDRTLCAIAKRRAVLDADEARWLREAEALQIWKQLGMVSALDYMERVLGYTPRTAQDRLRVARALGELPVLTAALFCQLHRRRGCEPLPALRVSRPLRHERSVIAAPGPGFTASAPRPWWITKPPRSPPPITNHRDHRR